MTISKLLSSSRDFLWNYPEFLFFGENSWWQRLRRFYYEGIPVSHFALLIFSTMLLTFVVVVNAKAILNSNSDTLIEGVIIGVDELGNLQQLNRINPLINTNIQLEKDLNELIYESLIEIDQNGVPVAVLGDFLKIEEGRIYQFKLKKNIYWHDGTPITANDVAKTFELLQSLEEDPKTSTIFSRAAVKMEIAVIDSESFEFKLKGEDTYIPELSFFEGISFKILPAHLITDIDRFNISFSDPVINRHPVGSGPFKFNLARNNEITLVRNDNYFGNKPAIRIIKFKLFKDENSAVEAIKSGQIHALTGLTTNNLRDLATLANLQIIKSNIIYNQYFAVYFNMGQNGPEILKDQKVRQALALAVNKDKIIETVLGFAHKATGPIPENSFAYSTVGAFNYNPQKAQELLTEAGWLLPEQKKVREKNGAPLSLSLLLVNNPDRKLIAEELQQEFADIGVEVKLELRDLEAVINEHIIPRSFDMILYGVQTFVDPDRYEFFHSSQIAHPGLNISSYASTEKRLTVIGNKTERIPAVDDDLEDGRKIVDINIRKRRYQDFLRIIANEVPAIFLFHPVEAYVVNKRLKNIDISAIKSSEHRFDQISSWEIKVE